MTTRLSFYHQAVRSSGRRRGLRAKHLLGDGEDGIPVVVEERAQRSGRGWATASAGVSRPAATSRMTW